MSLSKHHQEDLIIPSKDEAAATAALKTMLDHPNKTRKMGKSATHLISDKTHMGCHTPIVHSIF
ncbi:hypothetical protein NIES208_06865 [[Limnothrix rosea] IAM M-220]|nr:hypothetical protein NIES208_06865 [[Limnothrix rosea] IAM M-220]